MFKKRLKNYNFPLMMAIL